MEWHREVRNMVQQKPLDITNKMRYNGYNEREVHKMKSTDNYISINIKPVYNVFNQYTLDYDTRQDYITTVHGNRLEVEGGTWYLWCDSYLITSGNTRDLHAVKNVPHHDSDGLWNDIELDYTPVSRL